MIKETEGGTERLIDLVFALIREHSQRAIAHSTEKEVRLELLGLLEKSVYYETLIHRELSKAPIQQVLYTKGVDIGDIIDQLGAVTKIVEIEDGDKDIKELEHGRELLDIKSDNENNKTV